MQRYCIAGHFHVSKTFMLGDSYLVSLRILFSWLLLALKVFIRGSQGPDRVKYLCLGIQSRNPPPPRNVKSERPISHPFPHYPSSFERPLSTKVMAVQRCPTLSPFFPTLSTFPPIPIYFINKIIITWIVMIIIFTGVWFIGDDWGWPNVIARHRLL